MTAADRRWVAILGLGLVAITGLPYVIAFSQAGDAWQFSGFLVGVDDGNSYIAKMLLGSVGEWTFRTPYTLEPQIGVLVFIPYLLLGKLAAGPALHEQLVSLFHLARSLAIFVAVYGSFKFVSELVPSAGLRRWATLVAVAGGGLGWLLTVIRPPASWDEIPLAFLSPETFGFLATFTLPHLTLARGLMLLGLAGYLRQLRSGGQSWRPGLYALLATAANPLTGVSLGILIGSHQLVLLIWMFANRQGERAREFILPAARLMLPSAPYLVYLAWLSARDPFLIRWAEQNQVLSPPPLMYLLAYLPLIPAALAGLASRWRELDNAKLIPIVWLALLPFMIYAPVGVQRRLPEGSWLALVIAAAWGLSQVSTELTRRRLAMAHLFLVLPASGLIVLGGLATASAPAEPVFEPANYVAAYESMAARGPNGAAAVGDFRSANAAPAYAPVKVPIGHGPESINGEANELRLADFYAAPQSTSQGLNVSGVGIEWLLWGPREQAWTGPSFAPGEGWAPVGAWGEVRLFQWRQPTE